MPIVYIAYKNKVVIVRIIQDSHIRISPGVYPDLFWLIFSL